MVDAAYAVPAGDVDKTIVIIAGNSLIGTDSAHAQPVRVVATTKDTPAGLAFGAQLQARTGGVSWHKGVPLWGRDA